MVVEQLLIAPPVGLKPHQRVNDCREDLIKQLWVAKPFPWVLVKVGNPAVGGLDGPIRTSGLDHGSNQLHDGSIRLATVEVDDFILLDETASEPIAGAPPAAERLVYTVPEAGRLLGLSRKGSYEAARRGDIPTIRIGRLLVVPKAPFHRMLESMATGTAAPANDASKSSKCQDSTGAAAGDRGGQT